MAYNNYYPVYQQPMMNQLFANQQRLQQQYEQLYPQCAQNTQQAQGINGRIVDDISTVNANEIPMDGNYAYFPSRDGKEIYAKRWNANGQIETTSYLAQIQVQNDNVGKSPSEEEKSKFDLSDASTDLFLKRFDEIENKISELKSNLSVNLASSKRKKDGDSE